MLSRPFGCGSHLGMSCDASAGQSSGVSFPRRLVPSEGPVNYCNLIDLKVNGFEGVMLLRKQQPVGQQAGAAVEGALGGDAG